MTTGTPVVFPFSRSMPKTRLFGLTCRTGRTDIFEYRANGAVDLGAICHGKNTLSVRQRWVAVGGFAIGTMDCSFR